MPSVTRLQRSGGPYGIARVRALTAIKVAEQTADRSPNLPPRLVRLCGALAPHLSAGVCAFLLTSTYDSA